MTNMKKNIKRKILHQKKAQVKIQEMAFVLLAIALLAIIAFIFFVKFQGENIARTAEMTRQQEALSLLGKIAALQELRCSKGEICIDEDKAIIAKDYDLKNIFQGINKVEIKRIYPTGNNIIIYQSGKGNQSVSTFISLCRQESDWNCGIALLELWYQK
ncbi:MAG: hypothetical protein QW041_00465 [Candidatus Pacearchaeota archaeon]